MKLIYKKYSHLIFALICGITILSCKDGVNIYPVSDDIKLGKQLDSQMRSKTAEYPYYNALEPNNYLQVIVNEITSSPLIKYKSMFAFKVQIIKDDKTVNAFCTPGGYIYVYTGLIKFLDNEASIAGVIGHEIAHAERRHATQRMTKAYGIDFLLSLILGSNPSQIEQLGANLFSGLALLKNSRDDEYESDEYSFNYLKTSIWYPGAILYFFDKVKANANSGFLEELLSTHPLPENRYTNIQEMLKQNNIPAPDETNLFTARYNQFKSTLPQ